MGCSPEATICFGMVIDLQKRSVHDYFTGLPEDDEGEEALESLLWDLSGGQEPFFDITVAGTDNYRVTVLYAAGTNIEACWGAAEFDPHHLTKGEDNLRAEWDRQIDLLARSHGATALLREPKWLLVPYYG